MKPTDPDSALEVIVLALCCSTAYFILLHIEELICNV